MHAHKYSQEMWYKDEFIEYSSLFVFTCYAVRFWYGYLYSPLYEFEYYPFFGICIPEHQQTNTYAPHDTEKNDSIDYDISVLLILASSYA